MAALPFLACGSSNSDQNAQSTARPPTAAPSRQATPYGQQQVGNLLLTVYGASRYTDEVLPAAPGTHYVAVDLAVKNKGNQDYVLSILSFQLKDSDGHLHDPAITGGPEPQIGSSNSVGPGAVARGFVVFPVPDGSSAVELQYMSPAGIVNAVPVPPLSS